MTSLRPFALLLTVASALISAGTALGSLAQPAVVSENPVDYTPDLVATTAVARPHVDALAQVGSTLYAGGLFDTVASSSGVSFSRHNVMAFDAATGVMSTGFHPDVNDQVWAVVTTPGAVYLGGAFTMVNGVSRPALVKLDPVTGAVDPGFDARFHGGQVNDLTVWNGKLLVGGSAGQKLMALNLTTGANTGYVDLSIADPIPNAWGAVSVYDFAVNPAGTRLVATGNFKTVAGQSRTRLFMADLGATNASLSSWYYPGFAKPCSSTAARRIAYLQGVDFSPDGLFFTVTATGQIPASKTDIWPGGSVTYSTVCDAAGRFSLANDQDPVWVNYTGGDSVWSVADTGAAVYVQGHFQWLDNPNGFASNCPSDQVCASRKGIGAINPTTGMASPWNPRKPARMGGKDLLATSAGLWVGSDSSNFHGEYHRGIVLAPLP